MVLIRFQYDFNKVLMGFRAGPAGSGARGPPTSRSRRCGRDHGPDRGQSRGRAGYPAPNLINS